MNADIRKAATEKQVKLWQIADALGMADYTFSRKLRKELSPEEKQRVLSAIDSLAKEAV